MRVRINPLISLSLLLCLGYVQFASAADLPNVVVIFIDDMGYADIGPFGATAFPTPNLDRMAREGRRFTDFHVSSAVCSASRAALITGCYHERVGISGALGPNSRIGLSDVEVTMAEICKQKNYATTCIGKWHLGHHPKFLPTSHGFDSYYGLPYSNDMWPNHPDELAKRAGADCCVATECVGLQDVGRSKECSADNRIEETAHHVERNIVERELLTECDDLS